MKNNELKKDVVAGFLDEELNDSVQKEEIGKLVESSDEYSNEYQIQLFIKNLLQKKSSYNKTPDRLIKKILRTVGSNKKWTGQANPFSTVVFQKPWHSIITTIIISLAFILILFNITPDSQKTNSLEKQILEIPGFNQIEKNFNEIISGRFTPQLISDKIEEIKEFFKVVDNKYDPYVPFVDSWMLSGAYTLDDSGVKSLNHIYKNKNEEFIHFTQIPDYYIKWKQSRSISAEALKNLMEGYCYFYNTNNSLMLVFKLKNSVCIVFSNGIPGEIKNIFCNKIKD